MTYSDFWCVFFIRSDRIKHDKSNWKVNNFIMDASGEFSLSVNQCTWFLCCLTGKECLWLNQVSGCWIMLYWSKGRHTQQTYWVVVGEGGGAGGEAWGTLQQGSSSSLSIYGPLWEGLARAGMSTLWCCPSNTSSADHGFAHPPRCPKGWFWRGCRGVWRAWSMQVSVSWQLSEGAPVNPQGSRSFSTPSHWSRASSRRCREVYSGTSFRKPGFFFSESASSVHISQP